MNIIVIITYKYIVADLVQKFDPWLMENFYVSLEDILSGNITQDTIQAWVEWFIDNKNNMFYMKTMNESLPMSYYQQTFDEKYSQLMSNIAEMIFSDFTSIFDLFDMFETSNSTVSAGLKTAQRLVSRVHAASTSGGSPPPPPPPPPIPKNDKQAKIGRIGRLLMSLLQN